MRFTSSNPVLRKTGSYTYISDKPITYTNVMFKVMFLAILLIASAIFTIYNIGQFNTGILIGAVVIGFISVLIGSFSLKLSPIFSTIYAISEGVVVGFISLVFNTLYPGIAETAVATTLIVLLIMILLFSSGIIKITQKFNSILVVSLIAVIFIQLINLFFPFGTHLYTIISIFSAILSALFLLYDFGFIKNAVDKGVDAKVGWVLGLGLMVTIVWIYFEILRLLALTSRR